LKKLKKNPRKHLISFEIRTKSISLDVLSKKIGINPSSGSRNKGQKNKSGKKNRIEKYTRFRLFSNLPKTKDLGKHLDLIIRQVEKSKTFKKGILPRDKHLSVCIADIFDFNKQAYY